MKVEIFYNVITKFSGEKLFSFSNTELENASTTGRDHGLTVYVSEEPRLMNPSPFKPVLIVLIVFRISMFLVSLVHATTYLDMGLP